MISTKGQAQMIVLDTDDIHGCYDREEGTLPQCTISRYSVPCGVCHSNILPGDRMFCFATSTTTKSISWGHEACYSTTLPPPPTCRHWMRLGRCPSLQAGLCAFSHSEDARGSAAANLDKKRYGGRRNYVRNQHKNSVLRIFLMQTYGLDYLNQQDGVIIDAAGGKGELAWELINLSGVEDCVVVDPRQLNLSLVQTKWKKGLFEPKRTGPVFSKWYPACEDGCKMRQSKSPRHIRCFLDGEACLDFMNSASEEDINRTDEWYKKQLIRAKEISWTSKGLTHEDGTTYKEEEEVTSNNEKLQSETLETTESEISCAQEARKVLQKSHLIVGLHCDQAAGEIVDFAAAKKIPWCVVPCCTYSEMFSCRKLSDGTRVTSYDHLVQWLQERDNRAKVATLDMEGKNKVIYTLP